MRVGWVSLAGSQPPEKLAKSFMSKYHYVYKSFEEEGREYIGVRSCNCLPEEDTEYFGSFTDKTFFPTEKTILFVCETREEAMGIEIELHNFFDVAVNPQFANMAKATSTGFDRIGVPHTKEWKQAQSEKMTGENNPQYGRTGKKSPNYGVPHTEEHKKKISESKSGEKHPRSKATIVIKPDGTQLHFSSGREAARELGIPQSTLCRKYLKPGKVLKKGKFKDWQFRHENPVGVL